MRNEDQWGKNGTGSVKVLWGSGYCYWCRLLGKMGKLHIMVYFVVFIRGILHYSQLPKFDNWAALFSNQYCFVLGRCI